MDTQLAWLPIQVDRSKYEFWYGPRGGLHGNEMSLNDRRAVVRRNGRDDWEWKLADGRMGRAGSAAVAQASAEEAMGSSHG